jgi:heat shock protein HslJ
MGRVWTVAVALVAAGLVAMSGLTLAQDDATTPEGVDWQLASFLDSESEALLPVPLGVVATLRLEGGQAAGSGGCANTFGGGYTLDGSSLTFADELTTTLAACGDEDAQTVEDAMFAALPEVAGWTIADGVLQLTGPEGSALLSFEVPDVLLTRSQVADLATTLAALRADLTALRSEVTALNVERLRQRLRALETAQASLEDRVGTLESEASEPPASRFNGAERVLLEGIPARIADRCQPLRSRRPEGTRAAVTCTPNTEAVARIDYFLMEGDAAASAFQATMTEHGVPEATSASTTCAAGRRSQRQFIARGWQAEGCFRSGGRAQLRFVDNATACRQLPVPGGQRLRDPAIYMALEGDGTNIARVHEWATRGLGDDAEQLTSITRPIVRRGQPRSPSCPT